MTDEIAPRIGISNTGMVHCQKLGTIKIKLNIINIAANSKFVAKNNWKSECITGTATTGCAQQLCQQKYDARVEGYRTWHMPGFIHTPIGHKSVMKLGARSLELGAWSYIDMKPWSHGGYKATKTRCGSGPMGRANWSERSRAPQNICYLDDPVFGPKQPNKKCQDLGGEKKKTIHTFDWHWWAFE